MGRKRIVLTVAEEIDCPLFRAGHRMVLDLPGVDMKESTNVCTLVLSKFMPIREDVDCGEFEVLIRNYKFLCPRPTNPVLFDVEEVEEEESAARGLGGDVARSVAALKTIPVFRSLSPRALEGILKVMRIETFSNGEAIVRRGEPGRALYIVYRGQVEVLGEADGGTTRAITRLGLKECFGEISLLTGQPVNSTVRAVGDTALLSIAKPDFERILQENPILAALFTRLLAGRLTRTNTRLAEEEGKAFTGKLAVLSLAEVVQSVGEGRRSGTLVVENDGQRGAIAFRDGRIFEIRLGEAEGDEAFYSLVSWTVGDFWFDAKTIPDVDRVGRDIMELLLEGMRRMDESSGAILPPANPA